MHTPVANVPTVTNALVKRLASECGFELAGVAPALPSPDRERYFQWIERGMAGAMSYLTGRRAQVRADPKRLLPTVRSILCAGKLYNTPRPYSTELTDADRGWISRYAWGRDYHRILRDGLERLRRRLAEHAAFDWKICVDTAPLLERSYARQAGLGWIGKNTCLINQQMGSWFFLGELLTSLELEPDSPPPDRCGTCTRCIDACPTEAIVPSEDGWSLDSRRCISYFTIELRGTIPEEYRAGMGPHVFGCDICQDVCPWNRCAPVTADEEFSAAHFAPPLEELAQLSADEFHLRFGGGPVERARYSGFLRSAAVAMGNSRLPKFREPLTRLASSEDEQVAEHARWALGQIE
jgi:epoxyqueuosine reductase